MKKALLSVLVLSFLAVTGFIIYKENRFERNDWDLDVAGVGSTSSPRAVDLNGDGILDIVLGAGAKEFTPTPSALIAIDGKEGTILWKIGARNQFIGSPMFMDLNNDGIKDIFIGGRSCMLSAVDGKTGSVIWEYLEDDNKTDYRNDTTILNFYNPVFIPDVSGDGKEDILISYGGFIKALPTETNRPCGSLMIINSATGKQMHKAIMPDLKETYMSPIVFDFNNDGELEILFGSGGETISGNFYKAELKDLLKNDLSKAIVLDSGKGKGYIAPPLIIDINSDGIKDIIINAVNGRIVCIDGKTEKKVWEKDFGREYEIYTMPAPFYLKGREEVYLFSSLGHGVWPEINYAMNIVLKGNDGSMVYQDSSGTFQYASPVVFDFNEDGSEDILFAINKYEAPSNVIGNTKFYQNELTIFDIQNRKKFYLTPTSLGTNLGSTPLIIDLDLDGKVDVIYCFMSDPKDFYSFKNMVVQRREFNIDAEPKKLRWGSYMGSDFSSIY